MTDAHQVDPIALFRAAVDAADREAWQEVPRYCDPVSLRLFQRRQIEWVNRSKPLPLLTVDQYLEHQPDVPREVAEYHVASFNANADSGEELREEFPGVASVDQLRALDPATVYAKWLEGRSLRRQIERLIAAGKMSPPDPKWVGPGRSVSVPMGVVHDGGNLAHVLYRLVNNPPLGGGQMVDRLRNAPSEDQEALREVAERLHVSVTLCRRQTDGSWRVWAEESFPGAGGVVCVVPEGGAASDGAA